MSDKDIPNTELAEAHLKSMLTKTQVAELEAYLKSIGELPKQDKSK